ncbi:hypothetical protein A1O3_02518 [Capronia epimyces CBS 606.96]|uniref:NCS1 family nucleobase:cation symporter-1 n=1 Tax=Capronia epimyces CBS 606.96 TaxID=1182542 RepID=W9YJN8_9EURO|nr:uncharacterized protein A1O3_02518 [Capronia epimyces CBS 606.96]EXJ89451.1 hypothetical protein A1O3_02518 [Capronia epimyces CBS 606.96]
MPDIDPQPSSGARRRLQGAWARILIQQENSGEPGTGTGIGTGSETRRSRYLSSPDLAPVHPSRRTWKPINFITFWASASFNVNTWQLAGSFVESGLAWWHAWLCIWIAYLVTGLLIAAGGHPGAKFSVPFPVAIRSAFGVYGAVWPVFNRIILAIIWYSVQSWIGGECVYLMLRAIWPSIAHLPNHIAASMQTDSGHMLAFFVFCFFQLFALWLPIEKTRHLYSVKAIAAIIAGVLFAVWVALKAGRGPGLVMTGKSSIHGASLFWALLSAFMSSLNNWSTFILNDSDFSRFARKPSDAIWSQMVALPLCFSLTSLIGLVVSSCSANIYGAPLWNPLDVLSRFLDSQPSSSSRAGVFFLGLVFAYAQGLTNLACANSAGSDLTALFSRVINIRRGGYLTAALSLCCMPWLLLSSSNNFLSYVNSYSVFISAFVGPYFCDYFIIRRTRLAIPELYSGAHDGLYWGWKGFGVNGCLAYLSGVAFNIVGFVGAIGASVPAGADYLFRFNFIGGFLVSATAYYCLSVFGPFRISKPAISPRSSTSGSGAMEVPDVHDIKLFSHSASV